MVPEGPALHEDQGLPLLGESARQALADQLGRLRRLRRHLQHGRARLSRRSNARGRGTCTQRRGIRRPAVEKIVVDVLRRAGRRLKAIAEGVPARSLENELLSLEARQNELTQ